MAGTAGVRREPRTLASWRAKGRLLSRAMLNRMRTLIAWMARAQTKMANATSTRKILPHGLAEDVRA